MDDIDNEIKAIAESIVAIHSLACKEYSPLVDDICSRIAPESEVEHLLDCMLDFCGYDKFLLLFKQVCRKYYEVYPRLIVDYIYLYRDWYDSEENGENDTNKES